MGKNKFVWLILGILIGGVAIIMLQKFNVKVAGIDFNRSSADIRLGQPSQLEAWIAFCQDLDSLVESGATLHPEVEEIYSMCDFSVTESGVY